jgi:hypothetical protein
VPVPEYFLIVDLIFPAGGVDEGLVSAEAFGPPPLLTTTPEKSRASFLTAKISVLVRGTSFLVGFGIRQLVVR